MRYTRKKAREYLLYKCVGVVIHEQKKEQEGERQKVIWRETQESEGRETTHTKKFLFVHRKKDASTTFQTKQRGFTCPRNRKVSTFFHFGSCREKKRGTRFRSSENCTTTFDSWLYHLQKFLNNWNSLSCFFLFLFLLLPAFLAQKGKFDDIWTFDGFWKREKNFFVPFPHHR